MEYIPQFYSFRLTHFVNTEPRKPGRNWQNPFAQS
jgi:hypothetical protein